MSQKILVVEDEPASLRILRYFLSCEGYETAGAKDGVEAMELLAQCRFDLVLSDIKMPGMDGVALAKHILSASPVTPIFLISANISDYFEDILKLRVPYFSKPLSLDQLLSKIQTVLSNRATRNSECARAGTNPDSALLDDYIVSAFPPIR
jgi:CheY-like chemotaxis protein